MLLTVITVILLLNLIKTQEILFENNLFKNEFLNYISSLNATRYIYIYENYSDYFAINLINLKSTSNDDIRVYLYSSDSFIEQYYDGYANDNNTFNFYWYNIYCRFIYYENSNDTNQRILLPKIVFFIQNFKLLYEVSTSVSSRRRVILSIYC